MISALAATAAAPARMLSPDDRVRTLGVDYERGAQEGATDLKVRDRVYTSRAQDGEFQVSSDGASWTTILNVAGASAGFSFTFDALMRPVVVYQLGDDVTAPAQRAMHLYWYDNTLPGFTTLPLGVGVSPFLHFDYSVDSGVGVGEVVLFYIRDGMVYLRRQADRFTVETAFGAMPQGRTRITGVGLGTNWRLHVRCGR